MLSVSGAPSSAAGRPTSTALSSESLLIVRSAARPSALPFAPAATDSILSDQLSGKI